MFQRVAGLTLALILPFVAVAQSADAGPREKLGYGRLITNDFFGDGSDRWRTGSISSSRVWGSAGADPQARPFGDLIELRLSSEIFAPDRLGRPAAGDRPYAGALSAGVHTHFNWAGFETAMGLDLVVTGEGTGLGNLQRSIHKVVGAPKPSQTVLDNQIGGGLHPTLVTELGRDLALAPHANFRPFVEGRVGAETMLRAGFDLTFGTIGKGSLQVREATSGQRYRVIRDETAQGFTFLLGADMAHVSDSIYLPSDQGFTLTQSRDRLRAGLHWQGEGASAFYGLTYLGEEFEAQTEGQLIGSLRIRFSF